MYWLMSSLLRHMADASADPASLGYPPTLPVEIALRSAPIKSICEAYGISKQEWDELRVNPLFLRDLREAVDMLRKDGMSFRMKARLQAEQLLQTGWTLIHSSNDDVAPAVKADLIKFIIRAAGLDGSKDQAAAATAAVALQINLNM